MGSYVDWEKGECSFDGGKFRRLLELAASIDLTFLTQAELDEKLYPTAYGGVFFADFCRKDLLKIGQ